MCSLGWMLAMFGGVAAADLATLEGSTPPVTYTPGRILIVWGAVIAVALLLANLL